MTVCTPRPSKPRPKPKRLSRRKYVTQIAAFKCPKSVVLCADSQETRGTFKRRVSKIAVWPKAQPWKGGRIVFAGAGDAAFIDHLVSEMSKAAQESGEPDLDRWEKAMRERCLFVHEKFWKVYPKGTQPDTGIIFAISAPQGVRLLKSDGPIIDRIENYHVDGSSTELAPYLAEEMTHNGLTEKEATILSAYLLALSERYADGVGRPFHILILRQNGEVERLDHGEMDAIVDNASTLQREFNRIVLRAPDLTLRDLEISLDLDDFKAWVKGLRELQKRFDDERYKNDRAHAEIMHKYLGPAYRRRIRKMEKERAGKNQKS